MTRRQFHPGRRRFGWLAALVAVFRHATGRTCRDRRCGPCSFDRALPTPFR